MATKTIFMLDIARKNYTAAEIKEIILFIARTGYTAIQLHFSDNQKYGIASTILGQTTTSPSGYTFLTAAQVTDIVNYAKSFNIEVIPELGSPAHMGGIFALYKAKNGQNTDIMNSSNELMYTTDSAIKFVQKLYAEVYAMFGSPKFFHIGGDENGGTYTESGNGDFVTYLNKQAAYIKTLGAKPMAWNDGFMNKNLSLIDKDIIVTYWAWDGANTTERANRIAIRSSLPQLIKAGFNVINANWYYCYSVPATASVIKTNADFAANSALANWDPTVWDGTNTDSRLTKADGLYGTMMAVWGEKVTDGQTGSDILRALSPHIKAIADISNGTPNHGNIIKVNSYATTDNFPPNKLIALKTTDGVRFGMSDKAGRSVSWAPDSNYMKTYVQSRNGGLITNGSGLMGDNTNFSAFTYDKVNVRSGLGAFSSSTLNGEHLIDEYIPFNYGSTYRLSFSAKTTVLNGSSLAYSIMSCFDADKLSIAPEHLVKTTFTLGADVAVGATSVTVAAADMAAFNTWFTGISKAPNFFIGSYTYTNSYGYTYDPGTYTRTLYNSTGAKGASVAYNSATGVFSGFVLNNIPSVGLKAGTKVSVTQTGGVYIYTTSALQNTAIPTTWTAYSGDIAYSSLRPGTAFIKVGWWVNRSSTAGNTTVISGVNLREV